MIPLEQLRVGNIVCVNITPIGEADFMILDVHKFRSMFEFDGWKRYYPLPVTPIWIKRFGLVGSPWETKNIKHVHLLQNLHYWYTGKDLKLNVERTYK